LGQQAHNGLSPGFVGFSVQQATEKLNIQADHEVSMGAPHNS
jgi:hypothetical protein